MSRAYGDSGTTFISKKPFSHWYGLMKNYYTNNEVQCRAATTPVDLPVSLRKVKRFPTGSTYDGTVDTLGMTGYGEYTFPSGVVYQGNFHDGQFHGKGELIFNSGPEKGSVIQGLWINGVLTEKKIIFNSKVEYKEHHWKYCVLSDRRYGVEFETDLRPGGASLITPEEIPRPIPLGCYDTGDGFYNLKMKMLCSYDNPVEIKRAPSNRERKWITDNCRMEPLGMLGPRPDLYEKWLEPMTLPSPPSEPAVGFNLNSRIISTEDQDIMYKKTRPVFYDTRLIPLYVSETRPSTLNLKKY